MNALPRWLRAHPQVSDSLLAGFLLLIGLRVFRFETSFALAVPIVIVMTGALVFRRRYPVAVFAVVAGAAFVQWLADVPLGPPDLAILVALYTVAAYGRDRQVALAAGAVTVGGVMLAVGRWHPERLLPSMIVPLAVTAVALAFGDDRRTRREYFAGLEERTERLERERDALAALAASTERSRIARELHDVIAHSLSVMVAQADGASYTVDADPTRARRAMATVADTGRTALTEMRRMLGVLRPTSASGELKPQPGMDELPELLANVRGAGLPVSLVVDGTPTPLPTGMELAAYRIVQEALTNTLKHSGPGASAEVALRYDEHRLTVEVVDDGAGIRKPGDDAAGQGLTGMRERAVMYGGTLRAERRAPGGFSVTAEFPLSATNA
jgi:signal transduction histidine kinase